MISPRRHKKLSVLCLFVGLLVLPYAVFAEAIVPYPSFVDVQDIVATGEYSRSSTETLPVAQERAVYAALDKAAAQAGKYVEIYAHIKNMQLSPGDLRVMGSGVLVVTDKQFITLDKDAGGQFIQVTITCKVDKEHIYAMMGELQRETLEKAQVDYNANMQEVEKLKQELVRATTTQEKQQVEVNIAKNEQAFAALLWFTKGFNDLIIKYNFADGIAAFNTANSLQPNCAIVYASRGRAYEVSGLLDQAMADYDKAIALDSDFAAPYYLRGNLYNDRKRQPDLALADYTKAIALNPRLVSAYISRGSIYENNQQYDLAIADYTKAIELTPEFGLYLGRGRAYQNNGQYDQAIIDYTKVIELNPQFADGYMGRGFAYSSKNLFALALADYQQANALYPQYNGYYQLGRAYLSLGQYKEAIGAYNGAIDLDPKNPYAYYGKASALASFGHSREAIDCFNLFIQAATPGDAWIDEAKKRIRELEPSL